MKLKEETTDKMPLEMYEISGQTDSVNNIFYYYIKSKEEYQQKIIGVSFSRTREVDIEREIKTKKEDEIFDFIKKGLQDEINQVAYAKMIKYAPKNRVGELINIGFETEKLYVQMACASMLQNAPIDQMHNLIIKGINTKNPFVILICCRFLQKIKNKEEKNIIIELLIREINKFLDDNIDFEIQQNYINLTLFIPDEKLENIFYKIQKIIEKGITENEEPEKQMGYIKMLGCIKKEEIKKELIEKIKKIIEKGITENKEPEKQMVYVKMLGYVITSEDDDPLISKVIYLINNGLDNPDIEKQRKYTEMIENAPLFLESNFISKLFDIIINGLDNPDIEKKKKYAEMIRYLPDDMSYELIKKGLGVDNEEIQQICLDQIANMENSINKMELFTLAKETMGNRLVANPLYIKIPPEKRKQFSRSNFQKDGSETTLLGQGLEDKIIIRHIKPNCFLAWQKAYESYNMWKNTGFDYVPIEPIQKFRLNKETNLVDVFCGVLDCSCEYWKCIGGNFIIEIAEEMQKIQEILNRNKIIHGHYHSDNFCLRFFRKSNGDIDFTRKPRVYLIDFDRAEINN